MRLTEEREKGIRDIASLPLRKWVVDGSDTATMATHILELLAEIDSLRVEKEVFRQNVITILKEAERRNMVIQISEET